MSVTGTFFYYSRPTFVKMNYLVLIIPNKSMELTILRDIVIIFALSTFVNLLFTRLKIPTVVGYLLTGIIAGPHLLALVHEQHNIEILAEIGVVFLLFTIGLEFSLKHLLRIRRIVFFGRVNDFRIGIQS